MLSKKTSSDSAPALSADTMVAALRHEIEQFQLTSEQAEAGRVVEVGDGVAKVAGLPNAQSMEMIEFASGAMGVALNLEEDRIGVVVLSDIAKVTAGQFVRGTGKLLSIPVGDALLGRVVNPLGIPLDGKGAIKSKVAYPVERVAPGVMQREPVTVPLMTGIKAIDALIPVGRGQRELIIGDRQTGKTAIAIDTILNQKETGVLCVYVAIGQKASTVAKIVDRLAAQGALEYTVVVSANASDPASLQFIAPYAGAAVAEYFMDQKKDVLVVYDDLSKHAWAYREISLLLRRPPGREAYPGDVFYLHSRLLERASRRNEAAGGGSMTALPIIETQAGDVSAYIPTNVISITDGQIYLENDLFYRGIRPAVNVGLSVSRVGGAAQVKAMKKVAGPLRLELAQFRELEAFSQFSSDLDEATKKQIERGRRLVEVMKQGQYQPLLMQEQVLVLYAVTHGYADALPADRVQAWEQALREHFSLSQKAFMETLAEKGAMDADLEKTLVKALDRFMSTYQV